ncbi:MAG: hypothetical protein V4672_13090 [Verrucomicrobiota bacterium]
MYPSDVVRLKFGREVWMAVVEVDNDAYVAKTVWFDPRGRLQRSPDWIPQEALQTASKADTPEDWISLADQQSPLRLIRIGRQARLLTEAMASEKDPVDMTVLGKKENFVRLAWFDQKGEFHDDVLPFEVLMLKKGT